MEKISPRSVSRFLRMKLLYSRIVTVQRLNANPDDPVQFKQQVTYICQLHKKALELLTKGIHVVSTDEMSGIQALERLHSTLPVRPKQIERIEFEYIRHGTQTLLANWHIAKGQLINPTIGATRTEQDFKNHITKTLDTDPEAGWIFIVDQLNIHQSESRRASGSRTLRD